VARSSSDLRQQGGRLPKAHCPSPGIAQAGRSKNPSHPAARWLAAEADRRTRRSCRWEAADGWWRPQQIPRPSHCRRPETVRPTPLPSRPTGGRITAAPVAGDIARSARGRSGRGQIGSVAVHPATPHMPAAGLLWPALLAIPASSSSNRRREHDQREVGASCCTPTCDGPTASANALSAVAAAAGKRSAAGRRSRRDGQGTS